MSRFLLAPVKLTEMAVDCVLRDAAINGDERAFLQLLQNGEDASGVIGPLILGAPRSDSSVCLFLVVARVDVLPKFVQLRRLGFMPFTRQRPRSTVHSVVPS